MKMNKKLLRKLVMVIKRRKETHKTPSGQSSENLNFLLKIFGKLLILSSLSLKSSLIY